MTPDEATLARCFEVVFPELEEELIESASVDTVAEWDSLAAVTLVALVEEQFGIQIPESSLATLTSFGDFRDLLRKEHRLG